MKHLKSILVLIVSSLAHAETPSDLTCYPIHYHGNTPAVMFDDSKALIIEVKETGYFLKQTLYSHIETPVQLTVVTDENHHPVGFSYSSGGRAWFSLNLKPVTIIETERGQMAELFNLDEGDMAAHCAMPIAQLNTLEQLNTL